MLVFRHCVLHPHPPPFVVTTVLCLGVAGKTSIHAIPKPRTARHYSALPLLHRNITFASLRRKLFRLPTAADSGFIAAWSITSASKSAGRNSKSSPVTIRSSSASGGASRWSGSGAGRASANKSRRRCRGCSKNFSPLKIQTTN